MLPKPNQRQTEAIQNMARNGGVFDKLIEWLEDCLYQVREANDTLPPDEIQIGQGKAVALNSQIRILKELAGASPD